VASLSSFLAGSWRRSASGCWQQPARWLVTGSAGFIGSHLVETLLKLGQTVVGLDNFATGHRRNLDEVRSLVAPSSGSVTASSRPTSAISTPAARPADGVDFVLHQAALGSVPRSLANPVATNAANVDGFLNMLVAARDAGVGVSSMRRRVRPTAIIRRCPRSKSGSAGRLSPYAVSKLVNELYADVFARCYGFPSIGLRYFNVFGARQDPEGAYAAVIPRWTRAMLLGEQVTINGDGETSRDFCFVDNAVQANLLAATTDDPAAVNQVYNVAVDDRTIAESAVRHPA
jgi:UDP-N-acetylglucosamine 4-epimerase